MVLRPITLRSPAADRDARLRRYARRMTSSGALSGAARRVDVPRILCRAQSSMGTSRLGRRGQRPAWTVGSSQMRKYRALADSNGPALTLEPSRRYRSPRKATARSDLAEHDWLVDDRFSVADVMCAGVLQGANARALLRPCRDSSPTCIAARNALSTRGPLRSRIAPAPDNSSVTGAHSGDTVLASITRARHRAETGPLNRIETKSREGDRHPSASCAEVPERTAATVGPAGLSRDLG